MNRTLIIGITGNIGSGKSTVSKYLKDRGYYIIDADSIAHDITSGGNSEIVIALAKELKEKFGLNILNDDLTLNRRALAQFAFSNIEVKNIMETLVTGEIVDIIKKRIYDIKHLEDGSCYFLDAPLLFETQLDELTDYTWLVTAPMEERIKRVKKRDGISEREIIDREKNQMSEENKVNLADEVLNNEGDVKKLYEKVEVLLKKYAEL